MLPQRSQRIAIALAGLYVESMLLIFAAAIWLLTGPGAFHEIGFVFAVCLSARIALNLIPFLRLDGYWVLVDSLGIPNLRTSAFRYLWAHIPWLRQKSHFETQVTRKQAFILITYGCSSILAFGVALAIMLRNILSFASLWVTVPILLLLTVFAGLNLAAQITELKPRND